MWEMAEGQGWRSGFPGPRHRAHTQDTHCMAVGLIGSQIQAPILTWKDCAWLLYHEITAKGHHGGGWGDASLLDGF